MSTPKCLGVQIFRFTQVKLMIDPPGIKLPQQLYMVYSYTALHSIQLYMLSFSVRQLDR